MRAQPANATMLWALHRPRAAWAAALAAGNVSFPRRHGRGQAVEAFGPIGPACNRLETFGKGDEEKHACGLAQLDAPCRVISVGSNDQWGFEEEVVARTRCDVATLDCTVDAGLQPPPGPPCSTITGRPSQVAENSMVPECCHHLRRTG